MPLKTDQKRTVHPNFHGKPGRSGRKPARFTQYKDWFDANPHKIVELLEILYNMGLNGDRDAAIYVINRVAGTPKQTIDQRSLNIDFTPDDYVRLLPQLDARANLLTNPIVSGTDNTGIVKLPESENTAKSPKG